MSRDKKMSPTSLFHDSPNTGSSSTPVDPPPPFEAIESTTPVPTTFMPNIPPEQSVELPPRYADIINPMTTISSSELPFVRPLHKCLTWMGNLCVMDNQLDDDPAFLESWIHHISKQPMKVMIHVHGSHQEVRYEHHRESNGHRRSETRSEEVVDFDYNIDITAFLFKNVRTRESWSQLRVAEEHEKTYRGSICKSFGDDYKIQRKRRRRLLRGRFRGRRGHAEDNEEEAGLTTENPVALGTDGLEGASQGLRETGAPSLREWCHRYCASHAIRSFEIQRRVMGFDEQYVRDSVNRMVRSTGYMGNLNITFDAYSSNITIFSSCKINEWRMIKWLRWVFICTLLVIFVWPYLALVTRRWNVVFVDWYFSRVDDQTGWKEYVSLSEQEIMEFWGPAVREAALRGRRGDLALSDAVSARDRWFAMQGNLEVRNRAEMAIQAIGHMQQATSWGHNQ